MKLRIRREWVMEAKKEKEWRGNSKEWKRKKISRDDVKESSRYRNRKKTKTTHECIKQWSCSNKILKSLNKYFKAWKGVTER